MSMYDDDHTPPPDPKDSCEVVDSNFCLSPANGPQEIDLPECFACGLAVCESCSLVVDYLHFGKQRLGHDCIEQEYGPDDLRPALHLRELAGGSFGRR